MTYHTSYIPPDQWNEISYVSDFGAQGTKYSWQPGCSRTNSLLKDISVIISLHFFQSKT